MSQCLHKVFEFRHILRTTMNKEIFIGLMVAMFLGAGLLVVGVGIPTLGQVQQQQQAQPGDIAGMWCSEMGTTVFNGEFDSFTITLTTGTTINGHYLYDGSTLTLIYERSKNSTTFDISDYISDSTGKYTSFTATNEANGQVIHVYRC